MKREITFCDQTAIVERSKTACLLEMSSASSDNLAILADAINESEGITVIAVYMNRCKVQFLADRSVSNTEVVDIVCDAIGRVFDCDTRVNYARTENAV